jgi:competence protein ComEC
MNWHPVPFVRLLLPLILGIVLYQFHFTSLSFVFLSILLSSALLALLVGWYQKEPSIRAVQYWGLGAVFFLIGLGYSLSHYQDPRQQDSYVGKHIDSATTYTAIIHTAPERKKRSIQVVLEIKAALKNNTWQPCTGKVLAYLELDTLSIKLDYGRMVLFQSKLSPIEAAKNPAAFDMQQYYSHQHIYQQCYLPSHNWRAMDWQGALWQKQLYQWKQYLLTVLQQTIDTPNEYAVAAALLLGAKSGLDKKLKNAYADTGAMHVLAVSGLHVGILIGILQFLLFFLGRLGRRGKQLKALFLLVFLWLFALLTGASASVLRASTMFSFLLLGRVFGRSINVYNSLAASAFLLLCLDTNLLYSVGFQLSYLALIGIVYFYPKIEQLWQPKARWTQAIWNATALSLAAQLATTPLSLYYFHQFPLFFWLSSWVVAALAGVLLGLGIALLLVAQIPTVGAIVAMLFKYLLLTMNSFIFGIQQLPGAVWKGFWLEGWQLWLLYFILIAAVICLLQRRLPWGIATLTAMVLFISFEVWEQHKQLEQAQLCIYSSRKNSGWTVLKGRQAFTWADSSLLASNELAYLQQNYLYANGVTVPQLFSLDSNGVGQWGHYKQGLGYFGTTRLALYGPKQLRLQSHAPLSINYVLVHNNPRLYDLDQIRLLYNYETLVFDGSSSRWNRQRWAKACDSLGIDCVDVVEEGALVVDL